MRGATYIGYCHSALLFEFQSTLLMRGATSKSPSSCNIPSYFNPRSSCEERPMPMIVPSLRVTFQSTLLMRGATMTTRVIKLPLSFQSTLLMRGATGLFACSEWIGHRHFNPRSSCEERLPTELQRAQEHAISIHAPHARSDLIGRLAVQICSNFNPRSSCEERRIFCSSSTTMAEFQSTLLMRGATSVTRYAR